MLVYGNRRSEIRQLLAEIQLINEKLDELATDCFYAFPNVDFDEPIEQIQEQIEENLTAPLKRGLKQLKFTLVSK